MFPSQMVRLEIVCHSNQPFYPCFPRKWYALKLFPTQISHFIHVSLANGMPQNYFPLKSATLSMFPSQMVRLKIVSHSNQPLYPCFPRKWYALKLFPTQIGHLIHVSLANGTPQNYFPLKYRPFYPCFPHKWYALKLPPTEMGHFIHVSLANGTPQNCVPLKSAILFLFPSQMVRLKVVSHSNRPLYPCFPRKWNASKLFPTQIGHLIHVYMLCIFCCISPTQSSRISHCRSHDIVMQQKFLREHGSLLIGAVSAANKTDWLPKCGLELRKSSEGKMAMINVWNYSQKRGKYHGRQWILFDFIYIGHYNNMFCITWPILISELSVVA